MKARCIGCQGGDYIFKSEGEAPKVGYLYELEDIQEGTKAQNKAFHALLSAFYRWMVKTDIFQFEDNGRIFDFRTPSEHDFREFFKYRYGAGASHYQYVDSDYNMVKVKSLEEIPTDILADRRDNHPNRIKAIVKSWADYTKRERTATIQALIDIIHAVSCHDRRVIEIMEGME